MMKTLEETCAISEDEWNNLNVLKYNSEKARVIEQLHNAMKLAVAKEKIAQHEYYVNNFMDMKDSYLIVWNAYEDAANAATDAFHEAVKVNVIKSRYEYENT